MHRSATITLAIVLLAASSSCGSGGGDNAKTTTSSQLPAATTTTRPKSLSVHLTETADEYESADGKAINGSDGQSCPTTHEFASVAAKCWTWSAPGLGAGTYTQVLEPATGATIP